MTLSLPDAAPWPPPELAGIDDHPFDVNAHFAPIPADQNAAPLYLEALAEFDPEMADCFPESEKERIRRRAALLQEKFFSVFDVSRGRASPGVSGEIIDSVLAEYDAGFGLLSRAQNRPMCAFEIGHTWYALVPHLAAVRQMLSVVRVSNDRDLGQDRFDRPIRMLAMVLRLAADLKPRGSLICQVVAIAVERTAVELAMDILRQANVPISKIDRMLGVLLHHQQAVLSDPLVEGHRIEYVYRRVDLVRWERHAGLRSMKLLPWGAEQLTFGEVVVQAARMDFPMAPSVRVPLTNTAAHFNAVLDAMTADDFRREAGHLIDHYRKLIAVSQRPYAEQVANDPVPAGFFLTLPGLRIKYPEVFTRSVAALRMTLCLAAAHRWFLETGQHPPDLEWAAQSAGMSAVPADPYCDGPIQMVLRGGQPVMFCVGPSGANDGRFPGPDSLFLYPISPSHRRWKAVLRTAMICGIAMAVAAALLREEWIGSAGLLLAIGAVFASEAMGRPKQ